MDFPERLFPATRRRSSGEGLGWYGDSEAAERGWEDLRGGRSRSSSDYDSRGRFSRSRSSSGEGRGRYGDPEGHSEASEKGWRNR